ncbi:hypothetical protein SAMN05216360_104221 [Methylobacterium phyllostachyos]|uniref:Uncharacterized protein n=1 Tax=Methylobacterium phyllostachyos TaxID=582672 RepID=A0A1G9X2C1_9HYPH|nr:hypothetical protein SAMN05216360_104221 [Methylobacterium phyllostachyos]
MHALVHIAGQIWGPVRSHRARFGSGTVGRGMAAGSRLFRIWLCKFVLVWTLASILGGCVLTQEEPGDRALLEHSSPLEPADSPEAKRAAPYDAAWRLRLTRL